MFRSIANAWAKWRGRGTNNGQSLSSRSDTLSECGGQSDGQLSAVEKQAADLKAVRAVELEKIFPAASAGQTDAHDCTADGDLIVPGECDDRERLLVVVDVQERFIAASHEDFLQSTERLVAAARARDWPIIFLEYDSFGPSFERLLKLVKGYEHRSDRVTKNSRSGAREVAETCKRLGFACKVFRVCGVYTDYCVWETVQNLAKDFPGSLIEVVAPACRSYNQATGAGTDYDWYTFPLAPNIKLIAEEPSPLPQVQEGVSLCPN